MCSSSQYTITAQIYLKWLKVFHLENPSEMLKRNIDSLEKKKKAMKQGRAG